MKNDLTYPFFVRFISVILAFCSTISLVVYACPRPSLFCDRFTYWTARSPLTPRSVQICIWIFLLDFCSELDFLNWLHLIMLKFIRLWQGLKRRYEKFQNREKRLLIENPILFQLYFTLRDSEKHSATRKTLKGTIFWLILRFFWISRILRNRSLAWYCASFTNWNTSIEPALESFTTTYFLGFL